MTPKETPLKLTSPQEILDAIPFILGFKPVDSIVAVSLRGKRHRVGLTMRADFTLDGDVAGRTAAMTQHLKGDKAEGAILVAYVPEDIDLYVARAHLEDLADAAQADGIKVREALLVQASERWWSIKCQDTDCCSPEGTPVKALDGSRVAAEVVMRGGPMPFDSEAGLIESISYQNSPFAQRLGAAIYARTAEIVESQEGVIRYQKDALDALVELWDKGWDESPEVVILAEVIIGLQGILLRDYALVSHSVSNRESRLTLWKWLLTLAPESFVAPIACIVGALAYESGDGALAQRAIDRALEEDPDYSLANLLRRVFTAGFSPSVFTTMTDDLREEVRAAI